MLNLILKIGNYLNAGSNKGNAQGILINTLGLLENVKGKEKMNLLDFLILNLKKVEPNALNFPKTINSVTEAVQVFLNNFNDYKIT